MVSCHAMGGIAEIWVKSRIAWHETISPLG